MIKLDLKEKLLSKEHLEWLKTSTFSLSELGNTEYWEMLESHLILYEKYEELQKRLHPRCDCEHENFIDSCYKD